MSVPAVNGAKKRKKRKAPAQKTKARKRRRVGAAAKTKKTRRRRRVGKAKNKFFDTLMQLGFVAVGGALYQTAETMLNKSQESKPEAERINPMFLQGGAAIGAAFAYDQVKDPMIKNVIMGFGAKGGESLISQAINTALGVTGIGAGTKTMDVQTLDFTNTANLIPVNGYGDEAANKVYRGVAGPLSPTNININRTF